MAKRVHSRKAPGLPCRRYLLHFKWPIFGLCVVLSLLTFVQVGFSSIFTTDAESDRLELPDASVIYPVDVVDNRRVNVSIGYHFAKKDELKAVEDAHAASRKQKVLIAQSGHRSSTHSHLILEYTNVYRQPHFCSHTTEQIFGKTCPYTNCKYTCDRASTHEAQVLLMHRLDLNLDELDKLKRNNEQIWLLWYDEPNDPLPQLNRYRFNWTMSFRLSAEASLGAYGVTVAKKTPWSRRQFNSWVNQQYRRRRNRAVWFVSNCRPQQRLAKFRSLRRHYPIVAFGQCIASNESASLQAELQIERECHRQSSCEINYLSRSKFYLAFESQTCTDYISEKFWRALAFGAIPIVSGPRHENYLRVAPPHSFIHVDEYASDEQLAAALHAIGSNRTLFRRYHYWRRYYDTYHLGKDLEQFRFCELCHRLNTNKQRIWYEDISAWFVDQC